MTPSILAVAIVLVALSVLGGLMVYGTIFTPSKVVGRSVRAAASKSGKGHHGTWLRKYGLVDTGGDPSLTTPTLDATGKVTIVVPNAGQIVGVSVVIIDTDVGRIRQGTLGIGTFDLFFDDTTFAPINAAPVTFSYIVHYAPA